LKKDESNAVVHYDEAKKYFPREFNMLFGKGFDKSYPMKKPNIQNESINY
jgi:hypothetical protein